MRTPSATESLLDPSGGSPLAASAQWIEGLLLGEVGVILAIIAVAVTGLLLLTGRLAWRNAARVVLGCAIVFGAPAVAVGLLANADYQEPRGLESPYDETHLTPRESLPAAQERSGASLRRD